MLVLNQSVLFNFLPVEIPSSSDATPRKAFFYCYQPALKRLIIVSPSPSSLTDNASPDVINPVCREIGTEKEIHDVVCISNTPDGKINFTHRQGFTGNPALLSAPSWVRTICLARQYDARSESGHFCKENANAAVMACLAQYASAGHDTSALFINASNFILNIIPAIKRVMPPQSANSSDYSAQRMLGAMSFVFPHDADKSIIQTLFALRILKLSYETRIAKNQTYLGLFGFFGHSAQAKLAALNEYLNFGNMTHLHPAAKQGLLKQLIGAHEAAKQHIAPSVGLGISAGR